MSDIDQILAACRLDAYSLLDIGPEASPEEIRAQFRSKSLAVHPDKCKDPRAPEAFHLIQQAQKTLQDNKKRQLLNQVYSDCAQIDKANLRQEVEKMLIDIEVRRRVLARQNQEREARKSAIEKENADRLRENALKEEIWEEKRYTRVESWRRFQKHQQKKQKSKQKKILG